VLRVRFALLASTPRLHRLLERELACAAESQNYLVEALSGIATLKASGAEDRAFEHWSNLFHRQMNVSLRRGRTYRRSSRRGWAS